MFKTMWNTALTANDAAAREELGIIRETYDATNGYRMWKYIQFDNGAGNVTSVAGQVLYSVAASYVGAKVTNDVSDSDINLVAGVGVTAHTDTYYGWMQVLGYCTVNTDGGNDIAQYDNIIGGGDGTCNRMAQDTASTNTVLGIALADDGASTVVARLTVGA